MTVRVYRSTDASAPQFSTIAVGTLIPILDACLVTGYGSQAPAGWTKEYSGTNKAVYKQGTGSNGFYLWVNDTANVSYAFVRAYETMTGLDTGTNPFPTVAQVSTGMYWLKNSATNVAWMVVATERAFYYWTQYSAANNNGQLLFFGDIDTYVAGDAFNTVLLGGRTANVSVAADSVNLASGAITTATGNVFIARDYLQTTLSPGCSRIVNSIHTGSPTAPGSYFTQYDSLTGNIKLYQVFIGDLAGTIRGRLPGFYGLPTVTPYGTDPSHIVDIIGSGTEAGKTFAMVSAWTNFYMIETSDTW